VLLVHVRPCGVAVVRRAGWGGRATVGLCEQHVNVVCLAGNDAFECGSMQHA
jgi:hypothetical protein